MADFGRYLLTTLLASIMAAACSVTASATESQVELTPVSLQSNAGSDVYAAPVARIVGAIVDYSRWPGEKRDLTLCLARPTAHAGAITARTLSRGRSLTPVPIPARPDAVRNCDVLYIGQLPIAGQRALVDVTRGHSVLTIAEADPDCRSHAIVCLVYQTDGVAFQLNIDAVSRSSIAIDPRVLRLATRPENRR